MKDNQIEIRNIEEAFRFAETIKTQGILYRNLLEATHLR